MVETILARAYLGVDFFFVLSGFIMTHVNAGKTPNAEWRGQYVKSRLTRIYVPYLPIGIALALAYTFLPAFSNSGRLWGWYETLTLLPGTVDPALLVAWTLQHEIIFYLLFLLFISTGRPLFAAGLWAVAIISYNLLIGTPSRPLQPFLATINLEFLFGMLAAWFVRDGRGSAFAFIAAASCVLAIFVAGGGLPEQRIVFGLATALVLIPIVRWERLAKFTVPRAAIFLGGASYAIYLVHNPLIALLARMAPDRPAIALLWFAAASTAAGIAYHLLVELPGLRWTKRTLSGKPTRASQS